MIAVVICKPDDRNNALAWNIDSWLMSCRVLGREVEAATLSVIAAQAAEKNIDKLIGTYIPTDKNMLVETTMQNSGSKWPQRNRVAGQSGNSTSAAISRGSIPCALSWSWQLK